MRTRKQDEFTLTEKFLLCWAECADFNAQLLSGPRGLYLLLNDNPNLRKNYRWMQEMIEDVHERKKLQNAFASLKRRGFFRKESADKLTGYILTSKARVRISRLRASGQNCFNSLPRNQCLMVIYDIPEKKKKLRDIFRKVLCEHSFKKYQLSVWVTSNDVFDEIKDVIKVLQLEEYVDILKITRSSQWKSRKK